MDGGDYAGAIACLRRAAQAQPESVIGLLSLASALFEERQEAAAEDCLRDAVALDPRNGEAHSRFGDLLARLGRFDEAIACFEAALTCDPRRSSAYFGLVSSKQIREADRPLIIRMTTLLDDVGLTDRDRANLHFALGKAFDDLAEYPMAMHHFDAANRLEFARLNSPVKEFLDEMVEFEKDIEIPCDELFLAWVRWCERQNRKPGDKSMFGRDLKAALPWLKKGRPWSDSSDDRARTYKGMTLRRSPGSSPGTPCSGVRLRA